LERGSFELTAVDDERLLDLARRGERRAMDLLFSRHRCALRYTALKFLRNEAEAEDVVQDSLLSAFVHLSQYAGRAKFRTWLQSIVLNAARTRVRNRKWDRSVSLDEMLGGADAGPIVTLRDPHPGPDQEMVVQERRRMVREASKRLSPDFRAAYCLCYVKGLSIKEAAANLGVNEETLKTRLFRGQRKLTARLSAMGVRARLRSLRTGSPQNGVSQKRERA
jgi:RNA polymerase sigma-70 factor, ECF subfamily